MRQKSTPRPHPQAGATFVETMAGVVLMCLILGAAFFIVQTIRESTRVDRTLTALYTLKEAVKKANRSAGSYTQGRMLPLLFASNAFPESLNVNYDKKTVTTPMGHLLDVTGRGALFSIDLKEIAPNDCYDLGEQIVRGNYFMLGNVNDDFEYLKIGNIVFSDQKPLDIQTLQDACTQRFSIDVIMAFR